MLAKIGAYVLFAGAIAFSTDAAAAAPNGSSAGAGSAVLPVVVTARVESLFGADFIALTGWIQIDKAASHMENGRSVIDLEVVQASLIGGSRLGPLSVGFAPEYGQQLASLGEVRALTPGGQFPASSYLDLRVGISAPEAIPFGPLALHNEGALFLVPLDNGVPSPIDAWPPVGVQYGLAPPAGQPSCVPLLNADNSVPDAAFCIRDMAMTFPPILPSYSVARDGPRHLHPAGIFALSPAEAVVGAGQLPFLRISCQGLGLTADGCDDASDGDQDDLDALSYGADLGEPGSALFNFSVGPDAQGAAGSAVAGQVACPPASPGLAPEPEPDVFSSMLADRNSLLFDGNGPIGACTPAFPLGFTEGATVRDNLDALDTHDPSAVDPDGDGVPDGAVYFSLDSLSPSLAAFGATAGDLLRTSGGAPPSVFASAAQLGLTAGDDIDAMCLRESGDGVFDESDQVYVSLAPGSPSLALIAAGPGDLLLPGPLRVAIRTASEGLALSDDVDAAGCDTALVGATGDANCDVLVNSVDALLVLQYNAGLITGLPCIGGADADGSGGVDSVDATLILQYHGSLVRRLPPFKAAGR
ncbi:MAG: hypothetical protein WEB04_01710 [Dehalococcoidia bacterium]